MLAAGYRARLRHYLQRHWTAVMNFPASPAKYAPGLKATSSGQWRYALRNTIAMCLAPRFAYYLIWRALLGDETSGRSGELLPTVGGVISKVWGVLPEFTLARPPP